MTITETDFEILHRLREMLTGGLLDAPMTWVSLAGNDGMVWILAGLLMLCFRRTRPVGLVLFLALAFMGLSGNIILKPLIERPRPCQIDTLATLLVQCPASFSFPSGHSASSFAAAGVLWLLSFPGRGIAILLAAAIAFSRLYLYVHFPSDVVTGSLLGCVCAWLAVQFAKNPPEWFKRLAGPDTTLAPWAR